MKTVSGFFILVALQIFTLQAIAVQESVDYHMCRLDKTIRGVRVIQQADSKCMTVYTRDGRDQIVAQNTEMDSCDVIKDNVLKNLTDGGFSCKLLKNPTFTFIAGGAGE